MIQVRTPHSTFNRRPAEQGKQVEQVLKRQIFQGRDVCM